MVELFRTNKFMVLEREMLDEIINEQKFQLSGCTSDECLVTLGQIANVEQVVGGSVSLVGNVYTISARLISVETGQVISTGIYDHEGNIGVLVKSGMASIAAQLASIRISQKDPERSNQLVDTSKKQDEKISNHVGKVNITLREGHIELDSLEMEEVKSFFGANMVKVEGGTFTMGDNMNFGDSDERPNHTITLGDFFISKYEVTQKLYKQVTGENPSRFKGENNPIEKVSWYDAIQFCNTLSELEELVSCYSIIDNVVTCDWSANGYRLPTEAEWEFAARSGDWNDLMFFGSTSGSEIDDYAWHRSNSSFKTHEVGTKLPNNFGLHDMSGNVREWCWDWYGNYSPEAQVNPTGPEFGAYNIVRGGGYSSNVFGIRATLRSRIVPKNNWDDIGFRILRRS